MKGQLEDCQGLCVWFVALAKPNQRRTANSDRFDTQPSSRVGR